MTSNKSWEEILKDEKDKDYFKKVYSFQEKERLAGKTIYPESKNIFNTFKLTPFENIKVVILGQDPYHGPQQAMGLAFSVPEGVPVPPSLKNIFKEIKSDMKNYGIDIKIPTHGNLEKWAAQGVFLLNSVLTVESGKPASHSKKGWEEFTDKVIKKISENKQGVVFMLWGNFACGKIPLIDSTSHLILTSAHPSPLSAYNGFFGCEHFSKANTYLKNNSQSEIDWQL